MIEIICNEESTDKSKQVTRGAAIRRPKNIKQIGEVSSDKKIYIEDYAFTYINSIAYNNPSDSQAGVLLGESQVDGDEKCVFIKGVIRAKLGTEVEEKGVYFNENVWNGIYSDVEKYFPDLSVVGWFAAIPEVTTERMLKLKKIHLDNFAGAMKTFYLIDTVEKEENFYLYENGELKKQKGYVCFYERNYEMQEYMLERRERSSSEDGQDKVMKSIRNIIREKEELREQKKSTRFMYAVSGFMVVVILVISINLMNNYQKMKKFDKSISSLMVQMSGNDSDDGENVVPVNKLEGGVYPTEAQTETQEATISATATESVKVTTAPATEAQTAAASVSEPKIYTVKAGDTIMGICKRYYGDTSKCSEVIAFNNIKDENLLYVGQQIKLP
ncbi:MAG: LysM peptidoglycan-binding domain-containing protein [Lachnospira sp.]|nr:LysM peptidoglycan-binding domain-containing protein [Lachnospira sp.]MDY5807243.1 LysM peptidoglycan-binding domain-containing protein [Lachnospira sp.]